MLNLLPRVAWLLDMVKETRFFRVHAKTKSGLAQIDISTTAAVNELLLSGAGTGSLELCESEQIRTVLERFTARYQSIQLDLKDSREWTSADGWEAEEDVHNVPATPVSLDDEEDCLGAGFLDYNLNPEIAAGYFSDSASVLAEMRVNANLPNLRPRPFRASRQDIQSRVKGTSYADQPPWASSSAASEINSRLQTLNQFVMNLVGVIQCPAMYCGQGSSSRAPSTPESRKSSSPPPSSNRPHGSKRGSPSDGDSDEDQNEDSRRKRRSRPVSNGKDGYLCPLSLAIPAKMNRKAKEGQPAKTPPKCDHAPFENITDLRKHLRDDHKACPICLPDRPIGELQGAWYFPNDHCLRQHINAVHFKHCWTPCERCEDIQKLPGTDATHWQWKICKGCRKGDNRGAQAAKNLTKETPDKKKCIKAKLSDWYPALKKFQATVNATAGGAEMEKVLQTNTGEWKYDFTKKIDNLPDGFNAGYGQAPPTPPRTSFSDASPSPPADSPSNNDLYDDAPLNFNTNQTQPQLRQLTPVTTTAPTQTYGSHDTFGLPSGSMNGNIQMTSATNTHMVQLDNHFFPSQQTYRPEPYTMGMQPQADVFGPAQPLLGDQFFLDTLSSEPISLTSAGQANIAPAEVVHVRRPFFGNMMGGSSVQTIEPGTMNQSMMPDLELITQFCLNDPTFRFQLLQRLSQNHATEMKQVADHAIEQGIAVSDEDFEDSGVGDMDADGPVEYTDDVFQHMANIQHGRMSPGNPELDDGQHLNDLAWANGS